MVRDVIQQNDPVLRAPNEEISEFSNELETLIQDMFTTMKAANLAGLAAPQIGVNKRIFVAENTKTIEKEDGTKERVLENFVFINPQIVACSEATEERYEGCGSGAKG
jgi:peptide deformylase